MRRVKDDYLAEVLAGKAILQFDGAMGTMIMQKGLHAEGSNDLLCITQPDAITAIHRGFVEAGAQAITTNTFGTNARTMGSEERVKEVYAAAVACARAAGARYVAGDIGPLGTLLEPLGDVSFEEAYDLFAQAARAAEDAGADLIIVETMTDMLEAKAAVLAAQEATDLPVFATMSFGEGGTTFLGTTPEVGAITLAGLGVDALGINCSLGPARIAPLLARMAPYATCPLIVQANAGLPVTRGKRTLYEMTPEVYVAGVRTMVQEGATIIGGCCGTTPAFIAGEAAMLAEMQPVEVPRSSAACVTSARKVAELSGDDVAELIESCEYDGEPDEIVAAWADDDFDDLLDCAYDVDDDTEVLDVNLRSLPIEDPALLSAAIVQLQGATALPLLIDAPTPELLEAACRVYSGKPAVGIARDAANRDELLAVARRYGACVLEFDAEDEDEPAWQLIAS